jgi:hypothetical protein
MNCFRIVVVIYLRLAHVIVLSKHDANPHDSSRLAQEVRRPQVALGADTVGKRRSSWQRHFREEVCLYVVSVDLDAWLAVINNSIICTTLVGRHENWPAI